jgi:hypothetical protein
VTPPAVRHAIWATLVRLAREDGEPWRLVAVWMMAPGLRRMCRRCRSYTPSIDLRELQAEAVAGFLEALHKAEAGRVQLGQELWRVTSRHLHRFRARMIHERPVANVELTAQQHGRSDGLHVIVRLTSYLRDASYAEENARARIAALGGRAVPTTAVVVETLDSGWLVEIEVIAAG